MSGGISLLVQTRSIQQVLEPISDQVLQLIATSNSAEKAGRYLPDLVSATKRVCQATSALSGAARQLVTADSDEELSGQMPVACREVQLAGESLVGAAEVLCLKPGVKAAQSSLISSAQSVLDATTQVLLTADAAEVRQIIQTAHSVLDRLELVESVQSMRALLVCFKSFAEALVLLCQMADRRQKDLMNAEQSQQIVQAIAILQKSLPVLSASVQMYLKLGESSKASRDYISQRIRLAVAEIMQAVDMETDPTKEEDVFSANMQRAHQQLSPGSRLSLGGNFSQYMNAIIHNSMAVAQFCSSERSRAISLSCDKVTFTHRQLNELLDSLRQTPLPSTRGAFDTKAEELIDELHTLDQLVSDAVMDQVTTVFVQPTAPVQQLIGVATTHSKTAHSDSHFDISDHIDAFRGYAKRLCQVARYVAGSASHRQRATVVQSLATEIEKLIPQIISAADAVQRSPEDKVTRQHLDALRTDWDQKTQLLTMAIDEITDTQQFMAAAERKITDSIRACRKTVEEGNGPILALHAKVLSGQAERVSEVARAEMASCEDPVVRQQLHDAALQIDAAIPRLSTCVQRVQQDLEDTASVQQLAESSGHLLQVVRKVRRVLEGQPLHEDDQTPMRHPSVPSIPTPKRRSHISTRHSAQQRTPAASDRSADYEHGERQWKHTLRSHEALSDTVHHQAPADASLQGAAGQASFNGTSLAGSLVNAVLQARPANEVEELCQHVQEQADSLVRLAKLSVASFATAKNADQISAVRMSANQLEKLTPQLQSAAEQLSTIGGALRDVDDRDVQQFQQCARQWDDQVNNLGGAIDTLVEPWASPALKVAAAAKIGKLSQVETQAKELKRRSGDISALAHTAGAAAEAEGGSINQLSDGIDRDSEARARLVRVTASQVERLTPQLIKAAKLLAQDRTPVKVEHLQLLCREWGVQALRLATAVDDITAGTALPSQRLADAVLSHDVAAMQAQSQHMYTLTETLVDIAKCALVGQDSSTNTAQLQETAAELRSLTASLVEAANEVIHMDTDDPHTEHTAVVQHLEIHQREWAAKVHLVTSLIDILTAEVAKPIDQLAGAALAVSKNPESSRVRHIKVLREKLSQFQGQMTKAEQQMRLALRSARDTPESRLVHATANFIDQLTPQIMSATRMLSDKPDQVTVEHFQHLRRQWAAKVNEVVVILSQIQDANSGAVAAAIQELLGSSESIVLPEQDESPVEDDEDDEDDEQEDDALSPIPKTSSTLPPITEQLDDDSVVGSIQTKQLTSTPAGHWTGAGHDLPSYAVPSTPHWTSQRLRRHYSDPPEVTPRLLQGSGSSWLDEVSEKRVTPSQSIVVAARSLHREASMFEEEGNTLVTVAKKMSRQMKQMAEFTRRRGPLQSTSEMIETAQAIAANSGTVADFAGLIAKQTTDKRIRAELEDCALAIPTFSTQLKILSSVKLAAASPRDRSADVMLVKNAENLMQTVSRAMRAAEAACMKGLTKPISGHPESQRAVEMALRWKRKLYNRRSLEHIVAPIGALGLRRLSRDPSTPRLADLLA